MKYIGTYQTENDEYFKLESNYLDEVQQFLVDKMVHRHFDFYESANINEFTWMGRNSAYFYYSKISDSWHHISIPITNYYSYDKCKGVYGKFAKWIIEKTGLKRREDARIKSHFGL